MFDYKDFKKFANIVEAAEKLCGEDVVENYVDWAAFPFNFDGHEFREIEVSYGWNETKYVYVDNMPAEEYVKFFVLTEEMAEDLCMEIQSNLPSEPIEISYEDLEDMISSEESFMEMVDEIYSNYISKKDFKPSEVEILRALRLNDDLCCSKEVLDKYKNRILLYGFKVDNSIVEKVISDPEEAIEALKLVNVKVYTGNTDSYFDDNGDLSYGY